MNLPIEVTPKTEVWLISVWRYC